MDKNCLILGAGAIGKAVAGYVFTQMGMRTVFSDIMPALVADMNARKEYRIYETDNDYAAIAHAGAFSLNDEARARQEIIRADYIVTSVGPAGFKGALEILGQGLAQRDASLGPVTIFFFENIKEAKSIALDSFAKRALKIPVAFVSASIERMAKGYLHDGMYDVISEPFIPVYVSSKDMPKEEQDFFSNYPHLMRPVDNLDAYYYRKLYTNNMGHAVIGYMGYSFHCKTAVEALEIETVREVLREALDEAGKMLIAEYGFNLDEIGAHIKSLYGKRYPNRSLNDPLDRLARDPLRKLGRHERLTGTASLCLKHGIEPSALIRAMNYAMHYENPADSYSMELSLMLKEKGPEHILREVCGLQPCDRLYTLFLEQAKNRNLNG